MIRPINPPTHQMKHPPMGEEVSTNFKSLNGIELSQFVQFLLNFYCFGGPPRGWVGRWVGVGVGVGNPHTHEHVYAHVCTRMHACTYDIIGNSQWDSPMEAAICMKLSCLLHIHARACACVHMVACVGVVPTHPHPHPPTQ